MSNVTSIRPVVTAPTAPAATAAHPKPRELRMLNVSDVWIEPSMRLREVEDLDDESVGALAKSLKQVRQIEPIVVTEEAEAKCSACAELPPSVIPCTHGKRKYRLYVGERRLAAAKLAGQTTIEAVIDDSLRFDPVRAEDVPLHENVERVDHSVWAFYREVVKRRERHPDEKVSSLADRMDLSTVFIEDIARVHEYVAPDLVNKLRTDATHETFRHLVLASRIEGTTLEDRHKAQRAWWAAEGWRRPAKAVRGAPRGPRAPRRHSAREVERMARRIEDDRVVEADGERAELGVRAAKIVAALLRAVALPKTAPGGGTATDATEGGRLEP